MLPRAGHAQPSVRSLSSLFAIDCGRKTSRSDRPRTVLSWRKDKCVSSPSSPVISCTLLSVLCGPSGQTESDNACHLAVLCLGLLICSNVCSVRLARLTFRARCDTFSANLFPLFVIRLTLASPHCSNVCDRQKDLAHRLHLAAALLLCSCVSQQRTQERTGTLRRP